MGADLSDLRRIAFLDDLDHKGLAAVGETISYTFAVTNQGNVTLTNVTVTDPLVTVVGGPTTLDVGETDATTFTASYLDTDSSAAAIWGRERSAGRVAVSVSAAIE